MFVFVCIFEKNILNRAILRSITNIILALKGSYINYLGKIISKVKRKRIVVVLIYGCCGDPFRVWAFGYGFLYLHIIKELKCCFRHIRYIVYNILEFGNFFTL